VKTKTVSHPIPFELVRSDRTTLEISVLPDTRVRVIAPSGSDYAEVCAKVAKRGAWIRKQQRHFSHAALRKTALLFVGGSSHRYLGRQYRLKVVQGLDDRVCLSRGYIWVVAKQEPKPDVVKELLSAWYARQARELFSEIIALQQSFLKKHGLREPIFRVCKMTKRWGSLSKKGMLSLNVDLVRAPKECVTYVVVHELCHFKYHHHGKEFYRLLQKTMPDWERQKERLGKMAAETSLPPA